MKAILLVVCCLLFGSAYAQNDPFVGTWVMNTAASKYAADQLPKAMRIAMESTSDGIHYRSETTRDNDRVSVSEYTAEYGKPAMVIGGGGMMAPITLKRIDAVTVEALYVRGLQVVATSRRVLSNNGHVMTITTTSKDKNSEEVVNVGVYTKDSE